MADGAITERIRASAKDQIVIAGIDAHVCVLPTALDLRGKGREVFAVAGAISLRKAESVDLASARLRQAGADVVNVEMALFEWLGRVGTPEFKDFSQLIK